MGTAGADGPSGIPPTRRRGLQYPCGLLSLFGDSGLDGGCDFYDQGHLCGRAKIQGGAHLLSKHYFRGFYRLGGAVRSSRRAARIVGERRKGAPVASIDDPNPTKAVLRANLDTDCTIQRPNRRTDDLHTERNHPTANCPIGHASGSGANRVHSHRAPARTAEPHQARPGSAWLGPALPVPT